MTPTEVSEVSRIATALWPRLGRWTDSEWGVFTQNAGRIGIEPAQAEAALNALKATSDKFPTVAGLLGALRRAEAKPVRVAEVAQTKGLPPIEYTDGMTSFEWRVIQDPRFREFARNNGRLPPEREAWINEQARTRGIFSETPV